MNLKRLVILLTSFLCISSYASSSVDEDSQDKIKQDKIQQLEQAITKKPTTGDLKSNKASIKDGKIILEGDVTLQSGNYLLKTDQIEYDKRNELIKTDKPLSLTIYEEEKEIYTNEDKKLALFSAQSIDVSKDLSSIEIGGAVLELFRKNDAESSSSIFIAIDLAKKQKEQNETIALQDIVLSSCKIQKCDTTLLPWSLQAKKSKFNTEKNEVKIYHSFLRIFDIPILYLPYARINLDTNETFGMPRIEFSTGQIGIAIPYEDKVKKESKTETHTSQYERSFLFEPMFYLTYDKFSGEEDKTSKKRENALFELEHKYKKEEIKTGNDIELTNKIKYRYAYDYEVNYDSTLDEDIVADKKSSRYSLFVDGEIKPSNSISLDYNLVDFSDKNFLYKYEKVSSDKNYLTSKLKLTGSGDSYYFIADTFKYLPLAIDKEEDEMPVVLPFVGLQKTFEFDKVPGMFNFASSNIVATRNDGRDYSRYTSELMYDYSSILPHGQVIDFTLKQRQDFYQIADYDANDIAIASLQNYNRDVTTIGLNTSYPIVLSNSKTLHVLRPQVAVFYTPQEVNNTEIPNEDSIQSQISDLNIFGESIFNGFDIVEDGLRVAYGLSGDITINNNEEFKLSYLGARRYNKDSSTELIKDGFSSYVGKISVDFSKNLKAYTRILYNYDDSIIEFLKSSVSYHLSKKVKTSLSYTYLDQTYTSSDYEKDIEYIIPKINIKFNDRYLLDLSSYYDLNYIEDGLTQEDAQSKFTSIYGTFTYKKDCFTGYISFNYNLLARNDPTLDEYSYSFGFTLTGI